MSAIGPTHEVLNQPPALTGVDLFSTDAALLEGLRREGAGWAEPQAIEFGKLAGSAQLQQWGTLANENPPQLRTHDRFGHRIDQVEFHPAWHELLRVAMAHGLHSSPWREPRAGAHVARAAMFRLCAEYEAGHGCPISMTYSVLPALRRQPELYAEWAPRVCSTQYDPRFIPAAQKQGVLFGMALTEKQGGSDVRANTTRAEPLGQRGPGREYSITGHKWFCSAPMSDAFLVLAQAEGGLSCFLLPRFRPDGSQNAMLIQRLKDKLGNRSNASSEVEYAGAWARLVGEEGRGVRVIVEMINHTRLDCVIGSAGGMRAAFVQAAHHAANRSAFGKRLAAQPLMRAVLADLALESEAATALMLRLARAYDQPDHEFESAFRRIATAVGKFQVCKQAGPMIGEALECLGGNGTIEESPMPRLYREAPINSVWEGSGNVICLDVLRALHKEPRSVEALFAELKLGRGGNAVLDAAVDSLGQALATSAVAESGARRLVERLASVLQASLLVRHSPKAVADAFCATRVGGDWGRSYGTLPASVDTAAILARAWPALA
jgi:putative acyl-CoA dehydrogenase